MNSLRFHCLNDSPQNIACVRRQKATEILGLAWPFVVKILACLLSAEHCSWFVIGSSAVIIGNKQQT